MKVDFPDPVFPIIPILSFFSIRILISDNILLSLGKYEKPTFSNFISLKIKFLSLT